MSLKIAVQARLPLISVTTRDTLNVEDVIVALVGQKPKPYSPKGGIEITEKGLFVMIAPPSNLMKEAQGDTGPAYDELYAKFIKQKAVLIVVNPPKVDPAMFNAGELHTPRSLILKTLSIVTDDDAKSAVLATALGGCTLKEVGELTCMTMVRDKSLTHAGLIKTRKAIFQGSQGLTSIDTKQPFYEPADNLTDWIKREGSYFLKGTDPRLIARGLLFDGPPGLGKTAGAKYIAETLALPLYRFDLGGTKGKYVGQSEGQNLANLNRLDQEEPAVVLLDEIEKLFGGDSHETTQAMLSQILWWLAEHRSRVLTVMTTNNRSALPPELYREGRVDEVILFAGLDEQRAATFCYNLFTTFEDVDFDSDVERMMAAQVCVEKTAHLGKTKTYAHSALTKAVYSYVKANTVLADA